MFVLKNLMNKICLFRLLCSHEQCCRCILNVSSSDNLFGFPVSSAGNVDYYRAGIKSSIEPDGEIQDQKDTMKYDFKKKEIMELLGIRV